ncbi:penicillin-binding transpeptidase domain-containing protein [uncultured Eubacterium sp.]|uniref:penicillin-binding transpeptidase domain-containing protein n=1 Tax=uncultured Eubacterium sp. TaxID=165185 RepID=UPI0025952705|nr:penicillin-binding transpeptidase domain-containing protein [uncultured Eubacterium sp.]
MRKMKIKFIITAIFFSLTLVLILIGLNNIKTKSQSAIGKLTKEDSLQLTKLRELEENLDNDLEEGKVISSDNKILWSKSNDGYEDTFGLVGNLRDGSQLSNNTITYKYKDVLLPNMKQYKFQDGVESLIGSTGDIKLSLDYSLNNMIYKYMKKKVSNASALLVDIKTGGTIASVSLPSIKPTKSVELESLQDGSLTNKNLSGVCFPGSTQKIATTSVLAEIMGDEITTLSHNCNGNFQLKNGGSIKCITSQGNKKISSAIGTSCNSFFAWATQDILDHNKSKAVACYKKLGYVVGDDATVEYQKIDRLSRTKSISQYAANGSVNSTWSAIGEQSVRVNAYDMTNLVAAIFNDGEYAEPYIIQKISYKNGKEWNHKIEHKRILTSKAAKIVYNEWKNGFDTYYNLNPKIKIAKTGTAEIEKKEKGKTVKKDSSLLLGCINIKGRDVAFFINIEDYKSANIKASDVAEYIAENIG